MRNLKKGGWRPTGPKRSIPLPEAIDGRDWRIGTHSLRDAGMSFDPRVMVVPFGQEQVERMVRLHEMTHVKITPPEIQQWGAELPEAILQTVEDSRVHGQMRRLGFNIPDMVGVISDREMNDMATTAHPAIMAGLAASMAGTGEAARLSVRVQAELSAASAALDEIEEAEEEPDAAELEAAQKSAREAEARHYAQHAGAQMALRRMHDPEELPDFDTTLQMVKDLLDLFGDPDDPNPPKPIVPPQMACRMAKEMEPGALAPPGPEMRGVTPPPLVHGHSWSEYFVFEEPPLTVRLPYQMRHKRKKRPEVRGRRLHRVGRLASDGRVFAERIKKKGGGAVLIDTSGSMSLTPDEVLQLCVAYPGGVIAAYSEDGETGYLRVIARNGMRVPEDQIDPPGGGNGIDGPALDWLAKQPGPRWWISDAGVDGGAEGLRYCLQVCLRNSITRVDNAWEIVGKVTT